MISDGRTLDTPLTIEADPPGPATTGRLGELWLAGLAYTILVILFGAVVRITGSGAGCGQHWPTCQGEVVHLPQSVETVIELTHRITSGLSMLVVFVLAFVSFKRVAAPHPLRRAAMAAVVLMVVEALIGAALVLLRLVGDNDSFARAVIMGLHLVNTLALTGVMAWAALLGGRPTARVDWKSAALKPLLVGTVGIGVVAAAGAVTALGDTLYPATAGVTETVSQVGSAGAHFLERLRGAHPLLAIAVSGLLLWLGPDLAARSLSTREGGAGGAARWSRALTITVYGQLALGLLNVWLSAPGWMQVVHLCAALVLWLCWVGLGFAVLQRSG
ncbi:MAG: heme A synthase [Myxococcales bacterium]|nr:heme A synthase [Myxococcales bacterium]